MKSLGAVLLLALGGCGYSTGSLMPEGVRSVAVRAFGNETFYRRPEITFTRSLSRELVRRAGAVIRSESEADAVISGRIISMPRTTLVEERGDNLLEGGILVSIEVRMDDTRTGAPLIEPFIVSRRAEYIIPRGEALEDAIDEAVRDCAKDTVDRIEAGSFLTDRMVRKPDGTLKEGVAGEGDPALPPAAGR